MSGVIPTGFLRETVAEISAGTVAELRAKIDPRLVLDETTPEGNIDAVFSARLGEAWEGIEGAYHALDPDGAMGDAMVSLAELTGTHRRVSTRATIPTTCTLSAGTYPAHSLVACENGNAANRWRNISDVIVPVAGVVNVSFEAETSGSGVAVGLGDLVIAESVVGWSAIGNAVDSTPGYDLETIEALRARRRREIRNAGSATLGSIVAAVSAVDGVIDVIGEENTADGTVNSIPGHGIRITVWDGVTEAASDQSIAIAIGSKLAGGTPNAVPGGESVTYTTEDGRVVSIGFARATQVPVAVAVTTVGGDPAAIKAAIIAAMPNTIGTDISFFRLAAAPFGVAGVTGVSAFELEFDTIDVAVAARSVGTLDAADIGVTVT